MPDINILVVDDEKEIADLIEIYLVSDGYKVFKAENAARGLEILEKEEIHLVLLDIMMPGMNGLEMCKKIRENNNIPIIMLSAKSTDLDKILGLGTGADDYVVKPFNPLELTARVKSQLRRYTQLNPNSGSREQANNEITIKGMVINKDNHKVIVDDEEIKLTPHRVRHSLSPGLQPRQGVQHGRDLREGLEREGLRGEQYRYGTYQKAERQAEGGHQTEQNHYDSVGSRIQN